MPQVQCDAASQQAIKPLPARALAPTLHLVESTFSAVKQGPAMASQHCTLSHRADEDEALAALVSAMAKGDEQALSTLHQRTSARLRAFSMRLMRRVDLADELLMDIYWQAWRQAARFDPQRGSVLAWLSSIARSRALDGLRRISCRPLGQLLDDDLDRLACPDMQFDPPQRLAHQQLIALVQQALQRLSAQVRQLLSMALFGGMSHDEISRATQLPLGTVKSHIRRGLQRIKAMLSGPLGLLAQA